MEPIKENSSVSERSENKRLDDVIEKTTVTKKKILRGAMNYAGTAVGTFIIFVAAVVSTTDISIMTAFDWAILGLSFFVFLFCAYAMYVNGSGSGVRAGRKSEIYLAAKNLYDNLKREIIDRKMHGRLTEFCRYYIEEELRNTRNSLLTEVGIDFAKYQECYVGKDKAALEKIPSLSKSQVAAILAANKVKPIKLTPEMILKRGRGSARRNPLGIEPEKRRRAGYAMKFFLTFGLAILMTVITLNPKANLTWGTFAECILKLFPVMLNGFTGYKNGYENIIVHTVNYINDQIDLMRQLIHYVEENPTPKPLVSASEIVEEKEQTEIPAAENMPPADGLETVSAEAI